MPRLVAGVTPDGELAVVPAYFTHKSMLFDLPGLVVVGVRAEPSDAESRARTQSLARRLKTLADPTRLGMVDHLVQGPSTVSELARHFGIAQPTASNHVKLLRDAGLVTDVRVGSPAPARPRPRPASGTCSTTCGPCSSPPSSRPLPFSAVSGLRYPALSGAGEAHPAPLSGLLSPRPEKALVFWEIKIDKTIFI